MFILVTTRLCGRRKSRQRCHDHRLKPSTEPSTAEICWLSMLFKELKLPLLQVPVIWCDNQSAIALAHNPVLHGRTKHVELDYHFMREKGLQRVIQVCHIPSDAQQADILTKPMSFLKFNPFRTKFRVLPTLSLRGDIKDMKDTWVSYEACWVILREQVVLK